MSYIALKNFPYSPDGVSSQTALKGKPVTDLRDNLIPGLVASGLIAEATPGVSGIPVVKSLDRTPENKDLGAAPEDKTGIKVEELSDEDLRACVEEKTGTAPEADAAREQMLEALAAHETADEALTALRTEYTELAGKKFYHGWKADTLQAKIAELKAGQ